MESGNLMLRQGSDVINPTLNLFEGNFYNQITVPPESVNGISPFVKSRFAETTTYIGLTGLSEFATYDQDGKRDGQPVFPWRVRIQASGDYSTGVNWLADLQAIPAGAHIYDIYAHDKPCELGGTE